MEETQVCCCGTGGWTKVIAWCQIIVAVIEMIPLMFLLFTSTFMAANSNDSVFGLPSPIYTLLNAGIAVLVVLLILVVLSFAMGIVLLQGSHNKNPRGIFAWIVYTVVCVVIWSLLLFFQFVASSSSGSIVFNIIVLAIQGFCLWIVGTHKNEIEAATKPMQNLMYPVNVRDYVYAV